MASIEPYLQAEGHHISATRLYEGDLLPEISAFDFLIIMGGPMGVADNEAYPWLQGFIQDCIKRLGGLRRCAHSSLLRMP